MVTTVKQPIQIRLSDTELARLDAYRSTIGRFPPDRPAVVKTALLDWLAWQETGAPTEQNRNYVIISASASPHPDPSMEGGTPSLTDVAAPAAYDTDKYYLGQLCKMGHEYEQSTQSLRRRRGNQCDVCEKQRKHKGKEAEKRHSNSAVVK